ncbi:MAG TPA: DUF924 family protein [Candidatus Limnocylindrales bacterium]|nr:DUF924 family protein [Candidatus Limnocylindrales bacterium]
MENTTANRIEEILHFWFGDLQTINLEERLKLWFGGEEETDRLIRDKFEPDLLQAISGELAHWEETPRGTLALIILLDQFSRNIYRNTPRAFAQDEMALGICLRGMDRGKDLALDLLERVFFYLPMEHAEDLEIQRKSVKAFESLVKAAPPNMKNPFESFLDYAIRHYAIIEKFGRFPHRNEILGRASTPEELEFLTQPGSSF